MRGSLARPRAGACWPHQTQRAHVLRLPVRAALQLAPSSSSHHPSVSTAATASTTAAVAVERKADQLRNSADAALRRLLAATGEADQRASVARGARGADPADCNYCRYACEASGLPSCEAAEYLKMWDAESYMKPAFFDSTWTGQPPNTSGMAVVSMGGRCAGRWKPQNQDSFLLHAFNASSSASPAIVVGVFDGHGVAGAAAARAVRESMLAALARSMLPAAEPAAQPAAGLAAQGAQGPRARGGGTGSYGSSGGGPPLVSQEAAEGCLLRTFAYAEQRISEDGRDFSKSGATAVLCMLLRDRIVAAWAGDSRAVVGVRGHGREGYAAHPLTSDHKPDSPTELARIAAAGGRVDRLATDAQGNPAGPFRIFLPGQWAPGLAVARAFGDTMASEIGVTATPEFAVFPLAVPASAASCGGRAGAAARAGRAGRGRGRGAVGGAPASPYDHSRPPPPAHVLIVASDGLWEFVSNQRAVDIAAGVASAEDAAHALVEAAQKEWAVKYRGRNCDDISVAVAFL